MQTIPAPPTTLPLTPTAIYLNRKRWAEALESDKWEQLTGGLADDPDNNKRDALGVACEVYNQLTGQGVWRRGPSGRTSFLCIRIYNPNPTFPPKPVLDFFGLVEEPVSDANPASYAPNGMRRFSLMNDVGRLSFPEIAGYIREQLLDEI